MTLFPLVCSPKSRFNLFHREGEERGKGRGREIRNNKKSSIENIIMYFGDIATSHKWQFLLLFDLFLSATF
jgi:hypothetical protein